MRFKIIVLGYYIVAETYRHTAFFTFVYILSDT